MTANKRRQKPDRLEATVQKVAEALSVVTKRLHDVSDRLAELSERAEHIYDMLIRDQDVPVFDPEEDLDTQHNTKE